MRHRHSVNLGYGKSGLTEDFFKYTDTAKTERTRLARNGRRELRPLADDGGWQSTPTVSFWHGKDSDGDPTTRLQHSAPFT
jgi:hypothetical protein